MNTPSTSAPQWQFRAPTHVHFGRGSRRQLGTQASLVGRHALVVTGGQHLRDAGVFDEICADLAAHNVAHTAVSISNEPSTDSIDQVAVSARASNCDLVVAIGGGSALDSGKAAAALATNGGSCLNYLEGIPDRSTQPLANAPLPVIAVPTTAGTGSEVTANAVIQAGHFHLKRSLRDTRLTPRIALIDPDLMMNAPALVAAAAGFDALAHNLESFLSTGASPITDDMAIDGIAHALHFLRELADDGKATATAWDGIALAALTGGWCLANARLGAAHGLVAPLGGHLPIPHGIGVACLTAPALVVTDRALRERDLGHPARMRLHELAGAICGRGSSTTEAAESLDQLRHHLDLPGLRSYGLDNDRIPAIAAAPSSSIKTHPIELSPTECEEILQRAL